MHNLDRRLARLEAAHAAHAPVEDLTALSDSDLAARLYLLVKEPEIPAAMKQRAEVLRKTLEEHAGDALSGIGGR